MTPGFDLAPKRTRESTSRVRTGCGTCKARRVKCDEARPTCQRCAVANRLCEYKIVPVAARQKVITVYLPPTQSPPALFANNYGLDFFHQKLAAKLDGQFDSQFWSKLVLQLSHSEPSVRHAVSAISLIHQDVESSLRHPTGFVSANPKAQQEWSTAVKSLSNRIQTHPNSNLVPLVCCLLFTCIEFFRGNVESSMLHIEGGFSILTALHHSSNVTTEQRARLVLDDLKAIEDHIVPVFSRLNVLCSLAGKITPPICARIAEEGSPHEDLIDSRRRLYEVSDTCIRFIRQVAHKAAVFQIDMNDLVEQVKLQTRLDTWRHQLDELLERMQLNGHPAKDNALNQLSVHYKVIYIWLRVCTTARETATDSYHVQFEELVHCAEQITKPDVGTSTPQLLSFDMHITGPLYYTALKCRHPEIRRRALEILKLAPRREGLWNAHYAYATAQRVIELEERHLNGAELPDETSRLHGLTLPDDESRIYNLGEMPFGFQDHDHSIVPSPAYPGTLKAVFQNKPWGLLGEWQTVTEYIKL